MHNCAKTWTFSWTEIAVFALDLPSCTKVDAVWSQQISLHFRLIFRRLSCGSQENGLSKSCLRWSDLNFFSVRSRSLVNLSLKVSPCSIWDFGHVLFKVEFAIFQAILSSQYCNSNFSLYFGQENRIFLATRSVLWPKICRKCDSGRGSVPDPAGELTTLPQTP